MRTFAAWKVAAAVAAVTTAIAVWTLRRPTRGSPAGSADHTPAPTRDSVETICYERYATDPQQYQLWTDGLLRALHLPVPLAAAAVAVAMYVSGLALSAPAHFMVAFIATPVVYCSCLGVAAVVAIIHYCARYVHSAYEYLRPVFLITDEEYRTLIDRSFRHFANSRRTFTFSSLMALGFMVLSYVRIYNPASLMRRNGGLIQPRLVPDSWYDESGLSWKVIIAILNGGCVGFVLGTAARLLFVNVFFLYALRRLPIVPVANAVRARLRLVTDVYVGIALAWSVGVGLFALLFHNHYDLVAVAIMVCLSVLGFLTFLIPQIIFRRYLISSYRAICAAALDRFYGFLEIRLFERGKSGRVDSRRLSQSIDTLSGVVEATNPPRMWVYDTQDVFVWMLFQGSALLVVFAQGPVRDALAALLG